MEPGQLPETPSSPTRRPRHKLKKTEDSKESETSTELELPESDLDEGSDDEVEKPVVGFKPIELSEHEPPRLPKEIFEPTRERVATAHEIEDRNVELQRLAKSDIVGQESPELVEPVEERIVPRLFERETTPEPPHTPPPMEVTEEHFEGEEAAERPSTRHSEVAEVVQEEILDEDDQLVVSFEDRRPEPQVHPPPFARQPQDEEEELEIPEDDGVSLTADDVKEASEKGYSPFKEVESIMELPSVATDYAESRHMPKPQVSPEKAKPFSLSFWKEEQKKRQAKAAAAKTTNGAGRGAVKRTLPSKEAISPLRKQPKADEAEKKKTKPPWMPSSVLPKKPKLLSRIKSISEPSLTAATPAKQTKPIPYRLQNGIAKTKSIPAKLNKETKHWNGSTRASKENLAAKHPENDYDNWPAGKKRETGKPTPLKRRLVEEDQPQRRADDAAKGRFWETQRPRETMRPAGYAVSYAAGAGRRGREEDEFGRLNTLEDSKRQGKSLSQNELRKKLEEIDEAIQTMEQIIGAKIPLTDEQEIAIDADGTPKSIATVATAKVDEVSETSKKEELKETGPPGGPTTGLSRQDLKFVPKKIPSREASVTSAAGRVSSDSSGSKEAAGEATQAAGSTAAAVPSADAAGEKNPDEEKRPPLTLASRHSASKKLVELCHKKDWTAVESLLRTAHPNELNLTMTDESGLTAFMLAVKEGRVATVERLIDLGVDVNDVTDDGRTAAHIAAQNGREEVMRLLINKKADFSSFAGPLKQLPLHMACTRSPGPSIAMLQALIRSTHLPENADPRTAEDKNGATPLLLAIEAGNYAIVKDLLLKPLDSQVKHGRKDTGDTALHIACRKKDMELIRLILDSGVDVDARNNTGQTALHVVATTGDESALRLFYAAKANPNIADKDDKTPLHIATENGHTQMVEILIDKFKANLNARTKDGSTLMHLASQFGYPETTLAFLKRGVPLMMPNKSGSLGLHCAAASGHLQVVKTLLQKGTNVDSRTKDNYTALHVAVQRGHAEVCECLLGYGADVHVKGGPNLETALHIAAGLRGVDGIRCAEMVIKSGAEVNIQQENGESALHLAARCGNPGMVSLLLSEGADPTQASKTGETPVHIAVRYCHYQVLQLILDFVEQAADRKEDVTVLVNFPTLEGETTVHYAAELNKGKAHYPGEEIDITKCLLEYGGEVGLYTNLTQETAVHYCARAGSADILNEIVKSIGPGMVQIALNKQSKNGWSPLLDACERGHIGVVKILMKFHARVDVFDEHGKTGLHLAAENGHDTVCDELLQHKAFVNSKTKLGVTPLHLAAMRGHEKVVHLLVTQHKASMDALSLDGRTPLHVAAQNGQIHVCSVLLAFGANPNARDSKGQSPLHLAAESDFPDVVKLFLKMKPDLSTLTATDENGYTCAHIAAMKGSVAVVKQLMQIDKDNVISAATKGSESTALHLAAAGGHHNVIRALLDAGASPISENANGMTVLHLAARYGHCNVLDVIDTQYWSYCSKKTGLTALHVAAHFGQLEFVRCMLSNVPATLRSEPPTASNPLMVKELQNDYALTPLHMAAQSGHEGLVRLLLNSQGVQVDAPTAVQAVIPLHLAAMCGHIAAVGLLLSRSTHQLHIKDSRGRTALHVAAASGYHEMCALLIGQGSNINATEHNGWTALHFATKAGHMGVIKLLLESSADPMAETKEGKIALCFAAAASQGECLSFLMGHQHDTYLLLEDRKFVFDLMICAKTQNFKPIEEFVLLSPAPIDTAVKLSSIYRDMSSKEKERAKDLMVMSAYCEDMAADLMSIVSTDYNASMLLKSLDNRSRQFLDVLIENQQKKVVSHISVQQYLTEIWNGGITWGFWKFLLFFIVLILCPPVWVIFSLPLDNKICRSPVVRFICHLISHIYFTAILFVEVLQLYERIYDHFYIFPNAVEWILVLWLSGILVSELGNPAQRSITRIITLVFSAVAIILHIVAFLWPAYIDKSLAEEEENPMRFTQTLLYIKNQFFALSSLLCFIQFLDYLTVHHLFGPWAIIISSLLYDLMRFLVILALFMMGFTILTASIFKPAFKADDSSQVALEDPVEVLDMLFFALFGLTDPDQMPPLSRTPPFSNAFLKVAFAVYLMIGNVVLINLLIAMMSATYERIEAQSDIEWKFGRAKLIRQMNKKSAIPAPVNIATKLTTVLKVAFRNKCNLFSQQAQEAMRFEENIDSYSMKNGRYSPVFDKNLDDDDGVLLGGKKIEEGGRTNNIEQVIDWQRILDSYRRFQGVTVLGEKIGQEGFKIDFGGAASQPNNQYRGRGQPDKL